MKSSGRGVSKVRPSVLSLRTDLPPLVRIGRSILHLHGKTWSELGGAVRRWIFFIIARLSFVLRRFLNFHVQIIGMNNIIGSLNGSS